MLLEMVEDRIKNEGELKKWKMCVSKKNEKVENAR